MSVVGIIEYSKKTFLKSLFCRVASVGGRVSTLGLYSLKAKTTIISRYGNTEFLLCKLR